MNANRVKVGIVGLGRWAKVLTRAVRTSDAVEIVSGFSRSEENRAAYRSEFGIASARDHHRAIRIELAIVDVAVGVDKTHRYAERRASPSATEVSIFGKSASGSRSCVPGFGRIASQPPDSIAPAKPNCS